MILDTDGNRILAANVAVESGETVTGQFQVECSTGYAITGAAVADVTCEYKHSGSGTWTPSTTPIDLGTWDGTTQTFNFRLTAAVTAINLRRYLPITVSKSA